MKRLLLLVTALLGVAVLVGGSNAATGATTTGTTTVVAAGDIACGVDFNVVTPDQCQQAATARRAAQAHASYALLLGDLAFPHDSLRDLRATFKPTWFSKLQAVGAKLRPTPGNHGDFLHSFTDYDRFFGRLADPLQPGCVHNCLNYYSFDTGSWHIVSLNTSSCDRFGCGDLRAELKWLKADLAEHSNKCNLAFMHTPLFSLNLKGNIGVKPLWDVMQAHGVDVVLAAHARNYQRFAPQTPAGVASKTGITEIIAGTGGIVQDPVADQFPVPNLRTAFNDFGVVQLALGPGTWHSQFDSITGTVRDPASGTCH
jgi:hypothetical protein